MRIAKATRYAINTIFWVEIAGFQVPVSIENAMIDQLSDEETKDIARHMAHMVIDGTRWNREYEEQEQYVEPPKDHHDHQWIDTGGGFQCVGAGCHGRLSKNHPPQLPLLLTYREAAERMTRLEQK